MINNTMILPTLFQVELKKLNIDWNMVALLVSIEKFDSMWLSIMHKEFSVLETLKIVDPQPSDKILNRVIDVLTGNVDPGKIQALVYFRHLHSWFETESDIPPLMKCLLVRYFTFIIDAGNDTVSFLGSELATSLFAECGYSWVAYLCIIYPTPQEINSWLFSVLTDINDRQQMLVRKIDLYGAGSKLNLREQLLIHIIDSHKGIGTKHLVKKLGKSEATVRRMLSKLRRLNFIESFGKGPSLSHRIMVRY